MRKRSGLLFGIGAMIWGSAALAQTTITQDDFARMQKNTIATGIAFEMDVSIAPAVGKYTACLAKGRTRFSYAFGAPQFLSATRHAIVLCRKVRKQAMAEADHALARQPGWESAEKRAAEVNSVFHNTDASARKLALETDRYFERRR